MTALAVRRRTAHSFAFSPASIPWHSMFWASGAEFGALAVADGGAVASWPDEASARSATQATGAKQPLYRASSAGMGNRPVVEFSAAAASSLATSLFTALAQPNEIFIVARMRATTAGKFMFDGASGSRHLLEVVAGPVWDMYGGIDITGGTPDTSKHAFALLFDATDTLTIDGTGVLSGNAGAQNITTIVLGAAFNGTSSADVDIAFFGLSDVALTAQQRTNLLAWSRSFYGTP